MEFISIVMKCQVYLGYILEMYLAMLFQYREINLQTVNPLTPNCGLTCGVHCILGQWRVHPRLRLGH